MPGIGSIFAEQLRRCKDKLTNGDTERRVRELRARQDRYIQRLVDERCELKHENDTLRLRVRELAKDYEALRKSIVREVVRLEDTNGGT